MNRQAGFLSITGCLVIAIALLMMVVAVQTARLKAEKAAFKTFVVKTDAEGKAAQREADRLKRERNNITANLEKEHAKEYKELSDKYAAARADLGRVRNGGAGSGETKPLSAAAVTLACPDRQADAARRLERLEAGVLGLLERGDKAILRTIGCKVWLDEQMAVK